MRQSPNIIRTIRNLFGDTWFAPYVATATPAHPIDLMKKARKAVDIVGPEYLHTLPSRLEVCQ